MIYRKSRTPTKKSRKKSKKSRRVYCGGAHDEQVITDIFELQPKEKTAEKNNYYFTWKAMTEKAMILGQEIDKILPQSVLDRFQNLEDILRNK
jgi:hypothetical protein